MWWSSEEAGCRGKVVLQATGYELPARLLGASGKWAESASLCRSGLVVDESSSSVKPSRVVG